MLFLYCTLIPVLRYKADYSKYEPFIMPHKTKPKMLYCTLTGTELNRIPKQVEAHVNGKRFRSRKAEFEELSKREAKEEEGTAEEGSDEHDFWASVAIRHIVRCRMLCIIYSRL